MARLSCIVPFFNESLRISSTLATLSQCRYIDEIITIDDGSTDVPYIDGQKYKNKITFLKNKINKGKSHAVFCGLQESRGDLIILIDADLKDLRTEEIDDACKKMIESPQLDMIILKSTQGTLITRICRQDIVLSGARILKKKDLQEVFKRNPQRYQIETAINSYMISHQKNCNYIPFSAYNTLRSEKVGLLKATRGLLFLLIDVYSYNGYFPYLWQLLTFCHTEFTQSHSKSYSSQKSPF